MHDLDFASSFSTIDCNLLISWFIASTFLWLATFSFTSYIPARVSLLLYQNDVFDDILSISSSASGGDRDKGPHEMRSPITFSLHPWDLHRMSIWCPMDVASPAGIAFPMFWIFSKLHQRISSGLCLNYWTCILTFMVLVSGKNSFINSLCSWGQERKWWLSWLSSYLEDSPITENGNNFNRMTWQAPKRALERVGIGIYCDVFMPVYGQFM